MLLMLALPLLLPAESWVKFTSGPYEILTDAGQKPARETLVRLEEFRTGLGQIIGENDLTTPVPIRVLLFKSSKGWTSPGPLTEGRDRYALVLEEKQPISPDIYRELTRLFLRSNTSQMPQRFEHGLTEFFSTFSNNGVHITVGAPPPHPDLDWARIHLLVVDPQYFGKIRVLLYNLRKGVDDDPAYRNAFGKSAAEIETQAKQHLADGNFQTTALNSRPMAEKDFYEKPVSDTDIRLARADLLAGNSAAEYERLIKDNAKVPEAQEGLGLLALRAGNKDEARKHFAASMDAGSNSARCFIEYAKLEPDNDKATKALLRAAGINSKLDEPFALMAQRDTDPAKRLMHWKSAAERNPRNPAYWKELAEAYVADHNYGDAAKAWTQGEQSATDPAERQRMHAARMSIEQLRLDYEAAEKKRKADEDAAEIAKLKAQAVAEVHALEAKYSDKAAAPADKVVPWWDGPHPAGKFHGTLKQVDCLGKQARLVLESDDRKTVKLLVSDPGKISITGTGELTLGCGAQRKARPLAIEYFPKANARLATAGEVATIEFQ
jgi:tetratricopeptide (TPR) repeat protein